jgi:acyl carrier protein
MLDLDLDLEADLGVDTVKQAEMFAAIREIYNIPRDESRKLRDYPTLAHVIRFVFENRPDLAEVGEKSTPPPETPTASREVKPSAELKPAAISAKVSTSDSVKDRVLTLVVEKTGYPKDMLDLDLDLEADLGVDTVKQAEMFAAIREIYNIPRDENRKLRDYPTLAHVIRFVFENRPDLAGSLAAPSAPTVSQLTVPETVAATAATDDAIKEKVLEIVADKSGYPKDMLDLDLDLEADLGIDTVKQAEMFAAVRAAYNIPRDENLKLREFPTLAHVIKFARDRQPSVAKAPASSASAQEKEPVQKKPVASASSGAKPLAALVRCPPVSTPPIAFRGAYLFRTCAHRSIFASHGRDARGRSSRRCCVRQIWGWRRVGATAANNGSGCSSHQRRPRCRRACRGPQGLVSRGSGARSVLAACAGQ